MPKGCCGGGGTCACQIIGHGAVEVSGSGLPTDPFILDVEVDFTSSVNKTFTLTIDGDGSSTDPYSPEVTFSPTAQLDDLPDVVAPNPTNGQVLAWDGTTQRWVPRAPTTAPVGAVVHDTSLDGDGSAGTPLAVLPAPARFLGTFPTGLGLSDLGMASIVQHFVDAAARNAAIPSPFLNQMTMIDTEPGVIYYWTGVAWSRLPNQTGWDAINGEFLALSGSYTPGLQITIVTKQINDTTDAAGVFDLLDTTDLTGFSGVLAVQMTEQGTFPWKAMLNPGTGTVEATAYRVDDGSVMAGTPVTGVAQAVLY